MTGEELREARVVEEEQYEAMKLRIRYMYENGESSYWDMLFQSQSMSELLNKAEYISKISEYDRNQGINMWPSRRTSSRRRSVWSRRRRSSDVAGEHRGQARAGGAASVGEGKGA